jgi:hypothetical protein
MELIFFADSSKRRSIFRDSFFGFRPCLIFMETPAKRSEPHLTTPKAASGEWAIVEGTSSEPVLRPKKEVCPAVRP